MVYSINMEMVSRQGAKYSKNKQCGNQDSSFEMLYLQLIYAFMVIKKIFTKADQNMKKSLICKSIKWSDSFLHLTDCNYNRRMGIFPGKTCQCNSLLKPVKRNKTIDPAVEPNYIYEAPRQLRTCIEKLILEVLVFTDSVFHPPSQYPFYRFLWIWESHWFTFRSFQLLMCPWHSSVVVIFLVLSQSDSVMVPPLPERDLGPWAHPLGSECYEPPFPYSSSTSFGGSGTRSSPKAAGE